MLRCWVLLGLLGWTACSSDEGSPPADFSGYWDFDLTVKGTPCPGDVSGPDCFLILQTGLDLLVVDAVNGNLTGRVEGRVGTFSRSSPDGSDLVRLVMDDTDQRVTGFAVEADSTRECTTNLDIVGARRSDACVQAGL